MQMKKITSKVESRSLKQEITTQLANRSWQEHQNRSNSSVLRCGPIAVGASCSFVCETQTVLFFLHFWSLQNEGRQHGPRHVSNYTPQDTVSLSKILECQQSRCADLRYRNTNRVVTVTTQRAAAHNVSQLHVVVQRRYASAEMWMGSVRCAQHGDSEHCDNWFVALWLPARPPGGDKTPPTLLPQQFRTGDLLSRTCRLLHTAA